MRSAVPLAAAVLGLLSAAAAALTGEPAFEIPSTTTPPTVDGVLTDVAWAEALVVDDFVARSPLEGATPSARTEVRLVHSERALFVALRAFDPLPESIRARSMRRDDFAITSGDQFVIAIDSFHDRRNGYWFSTNPLGARVDAQFSEEGERFESAWDGVWDAAARTDDEGWTAEIVIPFSTLRFHEAPEVVMGINLFRRIPRTNEQLFAPAISSVYAYGTPNVSAARAYSLREISGGARVDLRPFALARTNRETAVRSSDELDGGLFARVPWSDSMTLAATLQADFSEVEADEEQLNLTRFPLFLPEQRDFFLESAGSFAFGVPGEAELFFSRTIGLATSEEGELTTVPIEWGAKATGQLGAVELGLLTGATGRSGDAPGDRFDVARARIAIGERSTIGGLWARRDTDGAVPEETYGVDLSHFFPHQVRVRGFAARSEGDARYLALDRTGESAAFELSWLDLAPDFAPPFGLLARPGTRRLKASLTLPWFPPMPSRVRRFAPAVLWTRYDDRDGTGFDERAAVSFSASWRSDRVLTLEAARQTERLTSAFTLYRDVVIPAGDYERWQGAVSLSTDATRPLSIDGGLEAGGLYGGRHRAAHLMLTWRPSRFVVLSPTVLADRVVLPSARFTAWVARLRLGLTASPKLRFDLLGQLDSEREAAGVGLRARYDLREGTRILLAWDSIELRRPLATRSDLGTLRTDRGALKLSYLLLF